MTDTTVTALGHEATADVPILEVTDLGVDFWVDGTWYPAAVHMTYDVKPGEVLAIVGESGSGKSSSSMALLGLLPRELAHVGQRQAARARGAGAAATVSCATSAATTSRSSSRSR